MSRPRAAWKAVAWLAAALAVGLCLRHWAVGAVRVSGTSMQNTLCGGDVALVTRFDYLSGSAPERGDVVECRFPGRRDTNIKRVIGLPGETVRIEDGKIFINDSAEPLKEGYLKEAWDVMNTDFTFVVPADSYLMLGDNRNWSEDARYWADNAMNEGLADTWEEAMDYSYVRKNKILGKAIFTYFRKFRILQHGTWYE